jgi:hypothetical protein
VSKREACSLFAMAVNTEIITDSVEPKKAVKKLDNETVPKLSDDAISVESTSTATAAAVSKWKKPYEPPPVVDQSTVLIIGFLIFGLAVLWPPLILLVAYIVSKLVPYSL